MTTPSFFAALHKVRILVPREGKIKFFWIGILTTILSLLEIVTALTVVLFAQILSDPETGRSYLSRLGLSVVLSPGRMIFYTALVMGGIYLTKNVLGAIATVYQHFAVQKMSYHVKNDLLKRYQNIDYGFYLTRNSSTYVEIIGSDVELLFSGVSALTILVSESIICSLLLTFMITMNPSLAFVIFGLGGLLGWLVHKGLLPYAYHLGQQMQTAGLQTIQALYQFFQAFKEMILYGNSEAFLNAYQKAALKKAHTHAYQQSLEALPRLIIESMFVTLFVVAIAWLCLEKETPLQMLSILAGYLYAGFRLMPGLNRVINQLNLFKSIIPSIDRVYAEYRTLLAKATYEDCPSFSFQHTLTVTNVSFTYLHTERRVLNNISFQIKKGECIGIVGKTGSGKSTLVDLLIGLLHPQEGSITIDQRYPVNTYQWHRCLGYVPQALSLIDESVEENIFFGSPQKDEERLKEVIEIAQLGEFIDKLPLGPKTLVGERGVRVSGGERQRIAIARALYHNPEVLIFDEATSALDQETEANLMEAIRRARHRRTVIMIAHRLTTLQDCDRIIVMKAGKIQKITDYAHL